MVAASARGAAPMPIAKPPAGVAAVKMKWRRVSVGVFLMSFIASPLRLHHLGGAMDRAAEAFVGAATANVGDAGVDLGVGGVGVVLEERRHGHDLPGLAVAALRHVLG